MLVGLAWPLLFAAGCGAADYAEVPVYPLTGSLHVEGEPAYGAYVTLHPIGDVGMTKGNKPFARVQQDGSFQISTYDTGDGAPQGEFSVTVVWPEDPEARGPSPDRLRGKYANPEQSDLKISIDPEMRTLPPWDLEA
jgi:hypothetical protein